MVALAGTAEADHNVRQLQQLSNLLTGRDLMTSWSARWEVIRLLGEGGQGKVQLARTKPRAAEVEMSIQAIARGVELLAPQMRDYHGAQKVRDYARQFAKDIATINRDDQPSELGALKELKISDSQATERFQAEVEAVQAIDNPALLRLMDADASASWMVSEYHQAGTLAEHPDLFKGKALEALIAFEPLVTVVIKLHERGLIHRDIKPANVFIASDGRLVLGDLGIVFWTDDAHKRLTETYERVGSRDWMAPWANRGQRLADVNETFDVFPLAKVLWAMVSGQRELPFWYWQDPEYNLEHLFPNSEAMYWINSRIFSSTIVERETQCVSSASELLVRVREVMDVVQRAGQRVAATRPCRVCGIGHYKSPKGIELKIIAMVSSAQDERLRQPELLYRNSDTRMTVLPLTCDACGHLQLFNFPEGTTPPLWKQEAQ